MSSRAIRKTQYQNQGLPPHELDKAHSSDDDEEEDDIAPAPKKSLFALLDDSGYEDAEEEPPADTARGDGLSRDGSTSPSPERGARSVTTSSKKKKKKKPKGKGKDTSRTTQDQATAKSRQPGVDADVSRNQPDDIDIALRSLAISKESGTHPKTSSEPVVDQDHERLCTLLATNQQRLIAANEMRQLFGRAALGPDAEDGNEARGGRRRAGGPRRQGLAEAVAGRNVAGGGGLAGLGLRRNIFVRGKEEWPRATGGGLGMEVVRKDPNGITEYRFVHNRLYQDVQRQFEACVHSMDPERMVQHLQFNRKGYHLENRNY